MGVKGIYFSLDALFASIIIISSILLFSRLYIEEVETTHLSQLSQDMLGTLSELRLSELSNSYVDELVAGGDIKNINHTILEQIGEFWALNESDKAEKLINNLTEDIFPHNLGYSIAIGNEEVYSKNFSSKKELTAARRMISGYEKSKPIKGSTSRAYLKSIQQKKFSSFVYFGGFIGQGNITSFIDDVPSGATMISLTMQLDAAASFDLFINGVQCGSTFNPSGGTMDADEWNLSGCLSSFNAGSRNEFEFDFLSDIENSYIGGGFIKASYTTDEFFNNKSAGKKKEYFPEIDGIINLYSSFYVPGTLNNLTASLHYYVDAGNTSNTLYFTIGNKTVFTTKNLTGEGTINLSNYNLSSQLTFSDLSLKTVPIRIGFENVTFGFIYEGNADVALITDSSGSMAWQMTSSSSGTARNCNDSNYNLSTTTRMSVAKCLDNEFAGDIINTSGNAVGLISFSDSTHGSETVYPTVNTTLLSNTIGTAVPSAGYVASGGTCICCGINSARDILVQGISSTTFIASGASWYYNNLYLTSFPPADLSGDAWYDYTYTNETSWSTANAILGSTNGYVYSPTVTNEIGNSLSGNIYFADLWERYDDTAGAPNDFSSNKLNSTGNTYGIAGANDGWDWDARNGAGPFGSDDDIDYNNVTSGRLNFDNNYNGGGNTCSNNDCSGAYGILINITPEMYTTLNSSGSAYLSFWYDWNDRNGNVFESNDQVWAKAIWNSPSSGAHYLGSDLDAGDNGADATLEVATTENPDNDFSGTFSVDLKNWIEGAGMYYLEIGGKILANDNSEYGTWSFDNIQLVIRNDTDHYFFRKHFTVSSLSQVQTGVLNVLSDDYAHVFLNGQLIDADYTSHDAVQWNRRGRQVDSSYFNLGDNVIAVEVFNSNASAKFDLELLGLNSSRDKAMLVMSDGAANQQCAEQGTGSSIQDAIQAACDARQDWGITVYSVGYSSEADTATLDSIAMCGDGISTTSTNTTSLQEFYQDVASSIVSASRHSQTIEIQGTLEKSILYDDSYIEMNYTPSVQPAQFGEIALNFEEKNFNNCTFNVTIPGNIRIVDALLTSYSSEHWTDALVANGNIVYNLSYFNPDYTSLGDPFIVNIPPNLLGQGTNTFFIRTGDSPSNMTGCSMNNTFIYTAMVEASVSYSEVLEKAEGCHWTIETEEGGALNVDVPSTYSGANSCSYTSSSQSYATDDSISQAVFELLSQLDFDYNGKINVNIQEEDLEIEALWVSQVPYLWGPAIVEVRVWQ